MSGREPAHQPDDSTDTAPAADTPQSTRASPDTIGGKVGLLLQESPRTISELETEWNEKRARIYFLIYSIVIAGTMLVLILFDRMYLIIGVFAIYVITTLPLLYLYEEEQYFQDLGINPNEEQ